MAGEIHHEIKSAIHSNSIYSVSRETLIAYNAELAKGDAHAYYGEREYMAVREMVSAALSHSFVSEANLSASEANRLARDANKFAEDANREARASRAIASRSAWIALASAIVAIAAVIISAIPLFK